MHKLWAKVFKLHKVFLNYIQHIRACFQVEQTNPKNIELSIPLAGFLKDFDLRSFSE